MKALLPVSSQPPSTGAAVVARLAASEPDPGSVRQYDASASIEVRRGR